MSTTAPERPNFLVIMTDQHRGDCLGLERHPVLLTPNIDFIGARGAHFTSAYATCPVCIPARRSLLTGQFPSTHGLVGYRDVEFDAPTIGGELRKAGYETAWIGRGTHQHPPQKRYGFDHMIASDHRISSNDYEGWLADRQPPGAGGYYGSGIMHNDWTARPWHMGESLHHTNWTVNEAISFVRKRDSSSPLLLVVSFIAPHPPLIPPAFYFERYIRTGVPAPVIGDWAEAPDNDGIGQGVCPLHRVKLTGEALLSARAGYYGLINHVDDQVRRLFSEVRGTQVLPTGNTVVIFCSDHGEMLGDHYLWRKSKPYEPSARIPLLIRAPKHFGVAPRTVIDRPVGLEDIMPTVLEMAGVDVPPSVDGRSLLPLMQGREGNWRPYIHVECSPDFQCLTDGQEKYIWFVEDGREQFFDLKNDPNECRDLIGAPDSAERIAWWRARLAEELADRPEGFWDGERLVPGRAYPPVMQR